MPFNYFTDEKNRVTSCVRNNTEMKGATFISEKRKNITGMIFDKTGNEFFTPELDETNDFKIMNEKHVKAQSQKNLTYKPVEFKKKPK
jgi:hypothetical protein